MKKLALLTAFAVTGLLGFSATNALADGVDTNTLNIKMVALIQTNDVVHGDTETARAMKIKVTTQNVLDILAEEFHTTFPDGAQLGQVDGDISVLDKNGNLILDVSSNTNDVDYELYFGTEGNDVEVGKETETDTKETENGTDYEYTFLTFTDSNSHIRFDGMGTEKYSSSYNESTGAYKETESMSLPGAGYANIDGTDLTLTGAITGGGKQSGIETP